MLRQSYMTKFRKKTQHDPDDKFLKEDEEYILKSNRPITLKSIQTLPSKVLTHFTEDIMTNPKICRVLYSTNASKEIQKYISNKSIMEKTLKEKPEKKNKNEPSDIIKNRIRKETFNNILSEVKAFKASEKKKRTSLKLKNRKFYNDIKTQNLSERELYEKQHRLKKIENIRICFHNIKERLDREHMLTSTTPNQTHTTQSNVINEDDELYNANYTCNYNPSQPLKLPKVRLDMKDVYSRLYNNAVYLEPAKTQTNRVGKRRKSIQHKSIENEDEEPYINRSNVKFKAKNALKSTNGKEFTIKLDESMILQCFLTYSGGVKALQILKQQRNEEQRKQYEGIPSSKDVDKNFYYNIKDENGNTFLHLATQSDLADLVRFLIEKGSNVNIQNKEGNTALHIALNNVNNKVSDLQIVDLLMKNGAHIDIVNAANKIPYDMASTEIKKKYGMDKEIMLRKINKRNNAKQQVLTTKKTGNVSI